MTATQLENLEHMRLGDMAVRAPGSTAVMLRFGLDFRRGGDKLLGDAVQARGVALDQIKGEFAALDQAALHEHPETAPALFDHLERCHENPSARIA